MCVLLPGNKQVLQAIDDHEAMAEMQRNPATSGLLPRPSRDLRPAHPLTREQVAIIQVCARVCVYEFVWVCVCVFCVCVCVCVFVCEHMGVWLSVPMECAGSLEVLRAGGPLGQQHGSRALS